MKKRMLSMLLAIVMVVGMLPVEALAAELVQITLDLNGGTLNGSTEAITFKGIRNQTLYAAYGGAYPIPQKAGYAFAGWYNAEHDMSLSEGDWSSFELYDIPEYFTAQWEEAAAEIDDTPYVTLQDALTAAQDGDVVKMLADVELEIPLSIPNSITLDLNGKTVEGSSYSISANGDLTIEDNSTEGDGQLKLSGGSGMIYFRVGGNLTVNSGKVSCSGSVAAIEVTGDLTITGGEVYGSASASEVIKVNNLTMTGGKLTASSDSGRALVINGQLGEGIQVESGALNSGNVVLVYAPEEGGEGEEPDQPETTTDTITLRLQDRYDDGWDGAAITAKWTVDGVEQSQLFTIEDGGKQATYELNVPKGTEVKFYWTEGRYPNECSFAIERFSVIEYECGEGDCVNLVTDEPFHTSSGTEPMRSAITVEATENGTVSAPASALVGQTVTLTVTPAEGYMLDTLTVKQGETEVEVDEDYSFTMPEGDVTVSATFAERTADTITLHLRESYGDSWNGSAITAKWTVDGVEQSQSFTITERDIKEATEELNVPKGAEVKFYWTAGSYTSECSFTIKRNGTEVYDCDYGNELTDGDLFYTSVGAAEVGDDAYYITGDFNGWDPANADAMTGQEDGTWTFTLTAKTGSFNILDRQGHWSEINKFGFANYGTYVQNGVSAQLIDKSVAADVYDINYDASYAEGDITVVFDPEDKTILLTWQETETSGPAAEIVGGTTYATLAEAISAAEHGDTVKLLKNIELTETLTIEKPYVEVEGEWVHASITLDLNGCDLTVTANTNYGVYVDSTDLIITDSGVGGSLTATGEDYGFCVYFGSMTVNGGEVTGIATWDNGEGVACSGNTQNAALTVKGGSLTGIGKYRGIRLSNSGDLIVEGGIVTGTATGEGYDYDLPIGIDVSYGASMVVRGGEVVSKTINEAGLGIAALVANGVEEEKDIENIGDYLLLDGVDILQPAEGTIGSFVAWAYTPDGRDGTQYLTVMDGNNDPAHEVEIGKLGTWNAPAQLQLGKNTVERAENDDDYYYTWTAPSDGMLTLGISSTTGWVYCINNMTTYAYGDTQWSDSDPVVNPAVIEVEAGDELQIVVNTYDSRNPWTTPAGTVTVTASFAGPVARIGETSYITLDAAFAAAQSNETIELLQDIELTETLTIRRENYMCVTLDLMGHDLTVTGINNGIEVYNTDLAIMDTLGEGSLTTTATGTTDDYHSGIYVENGSLWLTNCDVTATATAGERCYGIYVKEGNLQTDGNVIYADGAEYGIYVEDGNANFITGTITGIGKDHGIFVSSGSMTVTDGTITGTATGEDYGLGIYCSGNSGNEDALTIANGTVTGTGFSGGISVGYADLIVNGGIVTGTATGNEYASGIKVSYGSMIVNGGAVTGKVTGDVILEDGLGIAVYGNTTDLIQLNNGLSVLQPEGGVIASYNRPYVDGDEIGYETHVTVMVGDTPAREVEIAKLGTVSKPAQLQLGMNSVERAEGDDDYYYTWTAPGDGVLVIDFDGDNGWSYSINGGLEYSSDDHDVRYVAEVKVNAGDTVQIAVNTCDPMTAGTVEVFATFNSDLAIGGVPITPENSAGAGWSYDAATNTLTLDGFSYEGDASGIEYSGTKTLHLVLVNDSTITTNRNDGIRAGNANLIVSGSGSLTVNSDGNGVNVWGLTMNGGTLDVTAASRSTSAPSDGPVIIMVQRCAVQTRDALVMNDGTLTANSDGTGIKVMGNLAMNGGTLTGKGSDYGVSSYEAMCMSGGTVTGEGVIVGVMISDTLTMTGGTMNGTSTGDAYYGIYIYNDLDMSGGAINAEGDLYGVFTEHNLNLQGGSITISGNAEMGVRCDVELTISGGILDVDGPVYVWYAINIGEGVYVRIPENASIATDSETNYEVIMDADTGAIADRVLIGKAYSVTVDTVTNGTVTVDKTIAFEGETVTLTVTPEEGYLLRNLSILRGNLSMGQISGNSFVMPGYDVTIKANFAKPVARIGETTYFNLGTALGAAQDGETVTVLDDVDTPEIQRAWNNITLDLNGYTVNLIGENESSLLAHKDLTIADSSSGKTGKLHIDELSGGMCVEGSLNMTGGTVEIWNSNGLIIIGNLTVEGGSIEAGMMYIYRQISFCDGWGFTNPENAKVINGYVCHEDGMRAENVRIEKIPVYTITVDENIENGTVTADKTEAVKGERVTLTVTPAEGYVLQELYVVKGMFLVELDENNSFVMPNSNVTIKATFAEVEAKIGETPYFSLADALDAVEAGETIVLQKDADIDLLLLSDITLDLGGHTLTADSVAVFNGASIIDSTNGDGLLVTDEQQLILPENNGALPIWTENGFVFVTLNAEVPFNEAMAGDDKYAFQPLFNDADVHALLAQAEDAAVEVWVDWAQTDTHGTHKFVYSKEMLNTFLESYGDKVDGKYSKMFTIKLNGTEAFAELKVYAVVSGAQGVCFKADGIDLKPVNQ